MAVMGFRAFLVMDNKVARQEMAGNGGKWSKMVENGRKWSKKVHRGYLVENGFSRIYRLFPTTRLFDIDQRFANMLRTDVILMFTKYSCLWYTQNVNITSQQS